VSSRTGSFLTAGGGIRVLASPIYDVALHFPKLSRTPRSFYLPSLPFTNLSLFSPDAILILLSLKFQYILFLMFRLRVVCPL
jgi:hypothetical protein